MMFWSLAFLVTLFVALAMVGAVRSARIKGLSGAGSDLRVYRDQLDEIDRDMARGVLSETEAEAARTEVSRRLLEADKRTQNDPNDPGLVSLASGMVVVGVFVGAAGLYALFGAPGYRDLPITERVSALDAASAARPSQEQAEAEAAPNWPVAPEPDSSFLELMDRLRQAINERPDDIQGLTLLARNEARVGNFSAARHAQEQVVHVKGDEAETADLVRLLDVMVFAAGGYISPEAEAVATRLVKQDPNNGSGRYYQGLALAQSGRADLAFPIWRRLFEVSPPDAPWMPVLQSEIGAVAAAAGVQYTPPSLAPERGPSGEDIAAAQDMSAEERQEMIQGMVQGLSDRLASDGGPPEDWARLIRALGVLGDNSRAHAIADEARDAFWDDPDGLALINAAKDTLPQ